MNCSVKIDKIYSKTFARKCYFLFFWVASSTAGEIYQWTDASGRVHFGDSPAKNASAKPVHVEINTYTNVTYENVSNESAEKNMVSSSKKVVMYSTSWCGYCKKARSYFLENNIAFVDYDIEKDKAAKKRYDAMNARGVPVIVLGKKRMNGFSVDGFKTLLSGS